MTTVPDMQPGVTAPIRDLPTDRAKRSQAKLEGYRADYQPRGTLENDLVAEMAHLVLQLEQARAVAAAVAAIRVETAGRRAGVLPRRSRRAGWPHPLADAGLRRHGPTATACAGAQTRASRAAPYDRHIPQAPQGRRHRRMQYHRTRARVRRNRTGRPSSGRSVLAEPRAVAALRTRPRAQQRPSGRPGESRIQYHLRGCRPRRRGHPQRRDRGWPSRL